MPEPPIEKHYFPAPPMPHILSQSSRLVHTHIWNVAIDLGHLLESYDNRTFRFESPHIPIDDKLPRTIDTKATPIRSNVTLSISINHETGHQLTVLPPRWHGIDLLYTANCRVDFHITPATPPTKKAARKAAQHPESVHKCRSFHASGQGHCWRTDAGDATMSVQLPQPTADMRRFTMRAAFQWHTESTTEGIPRNVALLESLHPRRTWQTSVVCGPMILHVQHLDYLPQATEESIVSKKFETPTLTRDRPWRLIVMRPYPNDDSDAEDVDSYDDSDDEIAGAVNAAATVPWAQPGRVHHLPTYRVSSLNYVDLNINSYDAYNVRANADLNITDYDDEDDDLMYPHLNVSVVRPDGFRMNTGGAGELMLELRSLRQPEVKARGRSRAGVITYLELNDAVMDCAERGDSFELSVAMECPFLASPQRCRMQHVELAPVQRYVQDFRFMVDHRHLSNDMELWVDDDQQAQRVASGQTAGMAVHVGLMCAHSAYFRKAVEKADRRGKKRTALNPLRVNVSGRGGGGWYLWEMVVRTLYTNYVTDGVDEDDVLQMVRMSVEFEMDMLRDACEWWLTQRLTAEKCATMLQLVAQYPEGQLQGLAGAVKVFEEGGCPEARPLAVQSGEELGERLEWLLGRTQALYGPMLEDDRWADMRFVCDEERLHAHGFVLKARCPALAALMLSRWPYGKPEVYDLTGLWRVDVLKRLLRHVYWADGVQEGDDVVGIYVMAMQMGLEELARSAREAWLWERQPEEVAEAGKLLENALMRGADTFVTWWPPSGGGVDDEVFESYEPRYEPVMFGGGRPTFGNGVY